jgi:hypothetical protein
MRARRFKQLPLYLFCPRFGVIVIGEYGAQMPRIGANDGEITHAFMALNAAPFE